MILSLLNINVPLDTLSYLQNLNDNIDGVRNLVDVSNSTIANEISVMNTVLVVFTIVFGLVGIFVGVYISVLQRKVSKMSKDIEGKEIIIKALAKNVEDTDNKIHSDISGLYKQLREEETMTMFRRLEEEPQDIANLSSLLSARTVGEKGFPILKSAYMKLLEIENEQIEKDRDISIYKSSFLILFFQHYMSLTMLDNDIREDLRKEFGDCCKYAFKRDIIKSTKDLCKVLSKSDAPFEKEPILVEYLKAINKSKFKNLVELKNIFHEDIKNKSLLVGAIDKCTSDKVYLEMFGIADPAISNENNKIV